MKTKKLIKNLEKLLDKYSQETDMTVTNIKLISAKHPTNESTQNPEYWKSKYQVEVTINNL